jgi:hypothetical protein
MPTHQRTVSTFPSVLFAVFANAEGVPLVSPRSSVFCPPSSVFRLRTHHDHFLLITYRSLFHQMPP